MKDYYDILGVSKTASQGDIQRAFRKKAQQYHPDKEGGDATKFKEANEAYQVLNNPQKRAQYDQFGSQSAGGFGGQGFQDFDFSGFNVHFGGQNTNFSDILRNMFHGMVNRGEDIQADIVISFEAAVFGTMKKITIPYRRKKAEEINVVIPAGVESGMHIRMDGKGEPAKDAKAPPGDLFIRITVTESPHFHKRGGDIIHTLTLTPTEALLGAEKEIPDIRSGKFTVRIPELSQEGTAIAVEGRGIPRPAGTGRMVIVCKVAYPKKVSSRARELLEELRKEGW